MCVGVCVRVCVRMCVCGQTVCGTWLWIRTLLEQRLEAPGSVSASSAAAAVATKRRGYTPLPRPQVAYGNCLCDLLALPHPSPSGTLAVGS